MLRHVSDIVPVQNSAFSMIAVNFLTYFNEDVVAEKQP